MVILGIDPGTARTGYAVIADNKGTQKALNFGCIETPAVYGAHLRLRSIFREISEIIKNISLDAVAIEKVFFNKNVKTAGDVHQARGVLLLAAALNNSDVYEYTPLEVKQSILGYGNATKQQVQYMVKAILSLDSLPKPDDVADAMAVAICHLNRSSLLGRITKIDSVS